MASGLAEIASVPDQKTRVEQYRAWLHSAVASGQGQPCKAYIDHSAPSLSVGVHALERVCPHLVPQAARADVRAACAVLESSVPLTISRQLLSAFVQEITALPVELRKDVAT